MPPVLFRFHRFFSGSFLFLSICLMAGAGSRERVGWTKYIHRKLHPTFGEHGRTCDDHSALFLMICESIGRFCLNWSPHRFFTSSKTFLFRFFTGSLPFLYRFFTGSVSSSLPVPPAVLFRFRQNKRTDKEPITAVLLTLSIYIYIYVCVHMCVTGCHKHTF